MRITPNAKRMRRGVTVADRAQLQAGAAPEQEPADADHQRDRQVEDQVLAERAPAPRKGMSDRARNVDLRQLDARHTDIALAELADAPSPRMVRARPVATWLATSVSVEEAEQQREQRAAGNAGQQMPTYRGEPDACAAGERRRPRP